MAKQEMHAPSGMAGLVKYYEQEKSILKLKPEHVVIICVGFFVLEVGLHFLL